MSWDQGRGEADALVSLLFPPTCPWLLKKTAQSFLHQRLPSRGNWAQILAHAPPHAPGSCLQLTDLTPGFRSQRAAAQREPEA